jgi:hypothetical protein
MGVIDEDRGEAGAHFGEPCFGDGSSPQEHAERSIENQSRSNATGLVIVASGSLNAPR